MQLTHKPPRAVYNREALRHFRKILPTSLFSSQLCSSSHFRCRSTMPTNTIAPNQITSPKIHKKSLAPAPENNEVRSSLMADENSEIKLLYCPSTAKLIPYAASDYDKIDIGGIAKIFGLEPSTLKINGHFLGRGPDLIASSVTWKGLVRFFSDRGLPTGAQAQQPIVVSGKIIKPRNKRTHENLDEGELVIYGMENRSVNDEASTRIRKAKVGTPKKCKLENTESPHGYSEDTAKKFCDKRKHLLLDNLSLMKKLKINESESSRLNEGQSSEGREQFSKPLETHFPCSYSSQNLKRTREEETVVAMTPKRIK